MLMDKPGEVQLLKLMCVCVLLSGSGSLAAMAVFESRYKPDMQVWPPSLLVDFCIL